MKLPFLYSSIVLAISLTACQNNMTTHSNMTPHHPHISHAAMPSMTPHHLNDYIWILQTQNQHPIELRLQDGKAQLYAGCNRIFGTYQLINNTLILQHATSTMMACIGNIESEEQFAKSLFSTEGQRSAHFDFSDHAAPTLTIMAKDGNNYQFIGTKTPEAQYQSKADTIFLEIQPEPRACSGVAKQMCLVVREIQYDNNGLKTKIGEWENFYEPIQGFNHDIKTRNVIRVKRFTLKHPAADQSKYAYIYDMTVEQEQVR